jgi:hypothetical protein
MSTDTEVKRVPGRRRKQHPMFKPCKACKDLVAEVERLKGEIARLTISVTAYERGNTVKMDASAAVNRLVAAEARVKALEAFKAYVHKRLDDAGITTHPDGEHSKAGCRIGDRLDIALAVLEQKP